jgi:hypothetical protein
LNSQQEFHHPQKLNPMTLSGFILLSNDEKRDVLLHEGILIGKRKNFECMVFLFQLSLFYVEIYCNLESKEVNSYRAFEETSELNPYLENIVIDDLLK